MAPAKPLTRNITRLFREATPEQVQAGADWYADAHLIANVLADRHELTVSVVAGVIAALSPLNSWGSNVNLASRFLEAGGLHAGYLSLGLAKARDILAGADVERTLKGHKTVNFYRSIYTAGAQGVCIDRHAYSLALNDRSVSNAVPNLSAKRYAEFADAYVRAAKILSRESETPLTPAQVQSVTWSVWRQKFWSEGAFDAHTVELGAGE